MVISKSNFPQWSPRKHNTHKRGAIFFSINRKRIILVANKQVKIPPAPPIAAPPIKNRIKVRKWIFLVAGVRNVGREKGSVGQGSVSLETPRTLYHLPERRIEIQGALFL